MTSDDNTASASASTCTSSTSATPPEIKVHIGDLNLSKKVGEGSFSDVWIGSLKPRMEKFNHPLYGHEYACKLINKRKLMSNRQSTQFIAAVLREKTVLYACQSTDFIMHMYATAKNETQIGFITELCTNSDLLECLMHQKAKRLFRIDEVQYYGACIFSAIMHLQSICIVHRDIKPENILLTSEYIPKLSDFGCAKLLPPLYPALQSIKEDPDFVGTPEFMAPELITISKSILNMRFSQLNESADDEEEEDDDDDDDEEGDVDDGEQSPPLSKEDQIEKERQQAMRIEDGRLKNEYYPCLDYWSMGCLLYQLRTGKILFAAVGNEFQVFKKVKSMDFSLDLLLLADHKKKNTNTNNNDNDNDGNTDTDTDTDADMNTTQDKDALLKDLISKLLIEEPLNRIGVSNANDIISHPFFQDMEWTQLASLPSPTVQ